jgi:transposase
MSTQRYTPEFKEEAVRQIVDRGYSVADVSARLGVSSHSLYQWVKAVTPDKTEKQASELIEAKSEILKLRAQLHRTEEERDILKKAAVGSTIQSNTFVLMLHFREGGTYGSNGTPRSFRFAEVGTLATLEGRRIT